jgi:hypothetical protein
LFAIYLLLFHSKPLLVLFQLLLFVVE